MLAVCLHAQESRAGILFHDDLESGGSSGTPTASAAGQRPAISGASTDDGGCGCRVAPRTPANALASLVSLLPALVLMRRRQRTARQATR